MLTTDSLTGLMDMSGFMSSAREFFSLTDEYSNYSIVYINIEKFHEFNHRYGFRAGDDFLRHFANLLLQTFGESYISARLHDDHFAVLYGKEDVVERVESLHQALHNEQKEMKLESKAGIYFLKDHSSMEISTMLDRARLACNSISHRYDSSYAFYTEEMAKEEELVSYVLTHFETALEKQWIEVWYQPEIRALTGKECGFEALARWRDPEHGLLSPDKFISTLEDAHLIQKLDLYVIDRVCQNLKSHIRKSGACLPISVNLSRIDFIVLDMYEEIEMIRKKYEVPPSLLNIEITESATNSDPEYIKRQIERFHEGGYSVWMDDFGSGYSSLNVLKDFTFDVLKIDMVFLREFETNPKSRVILADIIDMAKRLGIHTLVEGVETKEQYEFMRNLGCEKIQGYYFSKPLDAQTILQREQDAEVLELEMPDLNDYYSAIGSMNTMSDSPLEFHRTANEHGKAALALLEKTADGITHLYHNRAYEVYLASKHIDSVEEMNKQMNDPDSVYYHRINELIHRCNVSDEKEMLDFVEEGSVSSLTMKLITSGTDRTCYGLVATNYSVRTQVTQNLSLNESMFHILQMYSRVDLFEVGGTAQNIFLGIAQGRVLDEYDGTRNAIFHFADNYIVEEERQAFIEFYDLTAEQFKNMSIKNDYISRCFHSVDIYGNVTLQVYIIVPFLSGGRQMAISCVRKVHDSEL